jgi:hypothetical protein
MSAWLLIDSIAGAGKNGDILLFQVEGEKRGHSTFLDRLGLWGVRESV